MEREEENEEAKTSSSSLFPLFSAAAASSLSSVTQLQTSTPVNDTVHPPPAWLCNTSFTTDLSIVNDAVSSLQPPHQSDSDLEENKNDRVSDQAKNQPYPLVEEPEKEKEREAKYSRSDSDYSGSDSGRERKKTKKRRHSKKKKRKRSRDEEARDFGSRKSNVRVWADSHTKTTKDYYFDAHGDRDNLVYGSLYRYSCANARIF
ncbi:unnamed protein product [Dovyalis caffra]|uniref:Uncharacterized protein n=1 Tax=Dovyalis caffra TaxID=77055 RepID=A0AAV1R4M7_9ROSI|nr:unnamed protein product [Dovyalis caffra]